METEAFHLEGGLAVTVDLEEPGRYGITHVASGRALKGRSWRRTFERREDAVAALRRLLTLTDWTGKTVGGTEGFGDRVRAAMEVGT